MVGRAHGSPPFVNVVVHGGPGAPGSAFGLAVGVAPCIEPFQTEKTVMGQIKELVATIETDAAWPAILIGHSWGAMLSMLVAASTPHLVQKVVLVCSGGFTAESYRLTNETRMARLSGERRARAQEIQAIRQSRPTEPLEDLTLEYYELISEADAYDPDPEAPDGCVAFQNDVNKSVWAEVVAMRETGELLKEALSVVCPATVIHGDHDPHPLHAIVEPLSPLEGLTVVTIPKCGHEPWKERQARDEFFEAMRAEL